MMNRETTQMTIDGKQIDRNTLQVTNILMSDYPDFCDAYFCYAEFTDGEELTDVQIDKLNETYWNEVNAHIHENVSYR
jgi:hypothetical protein